MMIISLFNLLYCGYTGPWLATATCRYADTATVLGLSVCALRGPATNGLKASTNSVTAVMEIL